MKPELEEGAKNCVVECAQVKKGDSVLILNQSGSVDSKVSDALAEAASRIFVFSISEPGAEPSL